MVTAYEAQYFVYYNGNPRYLGCYGGTTDSRKRDIMGGRCQNFIENLAIKSYEYIACQPWLSITNEYTLYSGFRRTPDTLFIVFYLSPHNPVCTFKYIGPIKYPHISGKDIDGYAWQISFEECFMNYFDHIQTYISLFVQRTHVWTPNHLLVLNIDQQKQNTTLHCVWSPITYLSEFYTTSFKKCPSDCYPIELRVWNRGSFYWIKKTAFDSGMVTKTDIIDDNFLL